MRRGRAADSQASGWDRGGPGIAREQVRRLRGMGEPSVYYAAGRWNGRTLREWVPVVIADIVREFRPARIVVFGSVARGEERDDSDLDVLVLFDEVAPGDRRGLMGRIRTAITAPIPVDVLVADVGEFDRRRDVNGSPYYFSGEPPVGTLSGILNRR